MPSLSMMLVPWLICLLVFFALIVYRSHLERHEVDEVFLSENSDNEREVEHDDIVRRVDQIEPYVKTAGGATALITVVMIGMYVVQTLPNVSFK